MTPMKADPQAVLRQDSAQPGKSLTARTVSGFVWTFSGAAFEAVLKIAVIAVLARLLSPADFGVVGAAMIVVAFVDNFGQIGVAPAIIQMKELTGRDVRTGFTIAVLFGWASGALVYLAAPLIAALFQMPAVEAIIQALAVVFPIKGVAIVAEGLLRRSMEFRKLAAVSLFSYAVGPAMVALVFAYLGWGVWSLVFGAIAQAVISSGIFLFLARHAVAPMVSLPSLRHFAYFGGGVTLARVGNYVAVNADYFVVARWLGAEALGYYSRAYSLMMQPTNMIGAIGDKVLFPALASVQTERERFLRAYYRSIALISIATLPLSAVLIVLAPELVYLLLGPQWDQTVAPFQILLAALYFRTAYKVTGTLLRAAGAVYFLAIWQWIYAACIVAGGLIGQIYGIIGVAVGVSVAIFASFWVGAAMAHKACRVSVLRLVGTMIRYGAFSAAIATALLAVRFGGLEFGLSASLAFLLAVLAALGVALAGWLLLSRLFGEEGAWMRSMVSSTVRNMLEAGGLRARVSASE